MREAVHSYLFVNMVCSLALMIISNETHKGAYIYLRQPSVSHHVNSNKEEMKGTHHGCEVIPYRSKEERKHPEEVKQLATSIDVTTECLLSISSSLFAFKCCNLIQPYVSTLPTLAYYIVSQWCNFFRITALIC